MSVELEEVTDADFESKVLGRDGATLVDFWASWCGPCRMLAPTLKELQESLGDRIKIVKMNTDTELKVAGKYGVQGLPTLMLFKDGQLVDQIIGNQPKRRLESWLGPHL